MKMAACTADNTGVNLVIGSSIPFEFKCLTFIVTCSYGIGFW